MTSTAATEISLPGDKELRSRVRLFGNMLGEVLLEQAGADVLSAVETLRKGYIRLRKQDNPALRARLSRTIDALSPDELTHVVRAFNLYFSLVNIADREVWVNDLKNTWIGDADLDGEFNSQDFVQVFQAGEYEDEIASNSAWSTGDWNGDAEFNSGDFVTAFQGVGFEQGPRVTAIAVPEPQTFALLLWGLVAFLRRSPRAIAAR